MILKLAELRIIIKKKQKGGWHMLLVILFVLLLLAILIGTLIKKFIKWVTSPVVYKTHIDEVPISKK